MTEQLTYEQIEIGSEASMTLTASSEAVEDFARVTGDFNPVHIDDDFAAKSFFKKRVAHGLLGAGLIGAVLGTKLPGPGAIYLSQEFEFKRPVYIGDTITAKVQVAEKLDKHKKVKLRTWVENQSGQVVLEGYALVLVR